MSHHDHRCHRCLRFVFAFIPFCAAAACQAQVSGYLIDQREVPVRSAFGNCWHTGSWTPAMAIEACDPDLVKKVALPVPAAAAPEPPPPAPPPTPRPVAQKVTLAADALFDFDRAELRSDGRAALDSLLGDSREVKLEVILVVGHSDRIGSDAYNQRLSERRAQTVRDYLVGQGVAPSRIRAEGVGERQPTTATACQHMGRESGRNQRLVQCLQPDRRVVIEVIGTR